MRPSPKVIHSKVRSRLKNENNRRFRYTYASPRLLTRTNNQDIADVFVDEKLLSNLATGGVTSGDINGDCDNDLVAELVEDQFLIFSLQYLVK